MDFKIFTDQLKKKNLIKDMEELVSGQMMLVWHQLWHIAYYIKIINLMQFI